MKPSLFMRNSGRVTHAPRLVLGRLDLGGIEHGIMPDRNASRVPSGDHVGE
jgi:hypothetical protein